MENIHILRHILIENLLKGINSMINGLSERLQKLRLEHGLSQKEVASRIGISSSVISGYETGERTPSAEVLLSLSYLYKCSTDYLLGKEKISSHLSLDVDGLNNEQIRALQAFIRTIQ